MRVPWTARPSNQPILKEINPRISLEGMMLKLKLQYFGHIMRRADSQFVVIHTVKIFGIVNNTEIDVFLELSCFFNDTADVGNLISGSSEPQFAPVLFLLTVQSFSIFGYKEHSQSDFSIDHLVIFMCRIVSYVVGKGCLLDQCVLLMKLC